MKNQFEKDCYDALVKEYGKNNVKYEAESFPYTLECSYTPDFRITTKDGTFFIESKGYLRGDHRRTLLNVKDQYEGAVDLRLLFQRDQKVSKGAKMKYSDWAERYGFQYAVGLKKIKDIL